MGGNIKLYQEFMKTFNIKPIDKICNQAFCVKNDIHFDCDKCAYFIDIYPEITSDILLNLVCILSKVNSLWFEDLTITELREFILETCIINSYRKRFKKKVQQLFEGVTK